ncbi:hypothetical protein PV327_007763 [Microctonus hyperodae]|uniref:Peptidase M12B domain-containing protein n=1 Tax=Microctonus hyperodae TaxID=165561 RepID=A0AA39G166_MICHY|nr:hypothetical protein PV327_007763 [Microctonus hyperodae]
MRRVTFTNSIFMYLLIIHSIYLAITNAQNLLYDNVTDDKLLKTERLKRSPTGEVPEILKATIVEPGKSRINLQWVKTDQLVANKYLPVWGARSANIYDAKKETSVMLDSFVMYQDVEQTSAIIYIKDKEMIMGYVDVTYYLNGCQIESWEGTVLSYGIEKCLKKNPSANVHGKHNRPQLSHINPPIDISAPNNLDSSTLNENSPKKYENLSTQKKKKKYYLETLLYITHDIVESQKKKHNDNYLYRMLLSYLVYFNAVDMMLSKLPSKFRVYFNLAGIIFEEDKNVFSSRTGAQTLSYDARKKNLLIDEFFVEFHDFYTSDPNFIFPSESYDYIFFSTKRDLEMGHEQLPALTIVGKDIYKMKYTNKRDIHRHSFSAVTKRSYISFPAAVHEIGHVLGCIVHDSPCQGENSNTDECLSIMQESLPFCYNCLKWSDTTVKQIEEFMLKERNRCWLLNFPRSLHKLNEPRIYLLPSDQCQCFGYNFYSDESNEHKEYITSGNCAQPLECVKMGYNNYQKEPTILPFDGVPCAEGYQRVCWNGQCVNTYGN